MGDKVSKIKKGIAKNLVRKVEFSDEGKKGDKITGQEILDLLSTLIHKNNRTVTHFHIKSDELTDAVAKTMETLLKTYTAESSGRQTGSLSFGLKDVQFSSKGIKHIFNSLAKCDVIGDLILHGTLKPIETSCIETLSKVLQENNSLKRIDFGGFAVTKETTRAMVRAMSKQRTLTHLVLYHWELKPEDLKILLTGCIFEFVDVTCCEINDDCCKVIGDILKKNSTLKKIVLDDNKKITDKGVKYIYNSLSNNSKSKLSKISLEKNKIDEDLLLDLVELIDERKNTIKSSFKEVKSDDKNESDKKDLNKKEQKKKDEEGSKKAKSSNVFAKLANIGDNEAKSTDVIEKV